MANEHVTDTAGEGPATVFLHALAGTRHQWDETIAALDEGQRLFAFDLPGHGDAPAPPDYSFGTMADAIAGELDGLGVERFALVGHSAGSGVAIALAAAHPERVRGLLLVDPVLDSSDFPREEMEGLVAALRSEQYEAVVRGYYEQILAQAADGVRERVLAELEATPKETVVGVFEAMMDVAPSELLGRYEGPRLSLVRPEADAPAALHRKRDDVPYELVEGTSHWLQLDRPEWFAERARRFLAELPA